jgi:hypothetical protein
MRTRARTYSRSETAFLFTAVGLVWIWPALASAQSSLVVYKDPNCGGCT